MSRTVEVDAGLVGKERGLPTPYPIICHLLDTAAVMGVLVDRMVSERRRCALADALGVELKYLRGLLMYWAALHDIGKITPPFQHKVLRTFEALTMSGCYSTDAMTDEDLRFHHSAATHWILGDLFREQGYPVQGRVSAQGAHQVAQLLGGHHGRFHSALERHCMQSPREYRPTSLGREQGWGEQSRAHAAVLREVLGEGASVAPAAALPTELAVIVAGLVVVADWLASQEEYILRPGRLPGPGWRATPDALHDHFAHAVADAPGLVAEAGLGPARFRPVTQGVAGFRERFPDAGWEPNQLQASLAADLARVATGPGLLLIAAPPGDGKTEAAEYSAAHLAGVSGVSGMAFALPTMATADAMFRRIWRFAKENLDSPASLALLHGMSWLNTDFDRLVEQSFSGSAVLAGDAGDSVFAAEWLRGARRGVLAAVAAMTIDQALVGVLPVKYNALRMLGLADKVLVVDEAHSYGPWMHQLLLGLLEWLGALGAPVVVMSATLAGRTARTLLQAYRRGCGHYDDVDIPALPYPGWMFLDASTGQACAPRRFGSDRTRELSIEMVPVTRQGESNPSSARDESTVTGPRDRLAVLGELLQPLVGSTGRVLVCCNTVAEAQMTFDHLLDDLGARGVEVLLLHSRFEAHDRARITADCERRFGKDAPARDVDPTPKTDSDGGGPGKRPVVLVATQIVEQSIDLDFDVMISDLAPIALLIQRAGRCQRHNRTDRPDWAGTSPRLVVLEPVDSRGEFQRPRAWGWVYSMSLLLRTSELLKARGSAAVHVPGDVQELVDAVYADDFVDGLEAAVSEERRQLLDALDQEDRAAQAAEEQLARVVRIPGPRDVTNLAVLSGEGGTGLLADDRLVATRLGADGIRLLPVFVDSEGRSTLDAPGRIPLPGTSIGAAGGAAVRLNKDGLRQVLEHTVPAPGSWAYGVADAHRPPPSWGDSVLLRDLLVVEGKAASDGSWHGELGARALSYDAATGLRRR
ncbi:CRISPR-associated helicase/endonuclease Cas3 [Streptacidiphilus albus]|uniref:CRISPR-associated helicase/endonuclease Cas3 n=1 Tax=Streptacidiphilus albus TaxID=105425 RepID=UPI00054B0392|nr:CRISPR-associated helicase/endonuclease Cas3 [Streptacidiphilus albus]